MPKRGKGAELGSIDSGAGWVRGIWPFFRVMRADMTLTLIMALVNGGVIALSPVIQRDILDSSSFGSFTPLLPQLGLLLLIAVIAFISKKMLTFRESKVIMSVQYNVRNDVYRALQRQDMGGSNALSSGQVVSRLNTDISMFVRSIGTLPRLSGNVFFLLEAIALMFILSPLLALVIAAMVPALVFIVLRMRQSVRSATWQAQQTQAELVQTADQAIGGVHVVKAFGTEQREIDRMVRASGILYTARMRLINLTGRFEPLLSSVPAAAQICAFVIGGALVLADNLTVGTFLAFSSYVVQLVAPSKELANTMLSLQEAGVCAGRVLELLDAEPAIVDDPDAPALPANSSDVLHFDHIDFGRGESADVLRGFRLKVAKGETVALVGGAGSGKSTVAMLAARLLEPSAGAVRLGETDINSVRMSSVHEQVGVLFENPYLFSGTIRENIAFSHPAASADDILAAAKAAQADAFVSQLPDGYDTVIGERGTALSGGQRQRIALARILLINPPVLVLDNPTSAVDATTERAVVDTLRTIIADRTVLLIAHSRATIELADRIAVLDGGQISDSGTHAELRERSARYRELIGEVEEEEAPAETEAPAITAETKSVAPAVVTESADTEVAIDLDREMRDFGHFRLREFLRPYRPLILVVLGMVILDALAGVVQPYLSRIGVDKGIVAHAPTWLYISAAAFACVAFLDLFLVRAIIRKSGKLGQRLVFALRMRIWAQLQRLPIDYFERTMAGQILTRVVNDVESFSMLLSAGLVLVIASGFTLIGIVVVMLLMSLPLTGIALLTLVPIAAVTWIFQRKVTKPYRDSRETIGTLNSMLRESFRGMRESRSFGQEANQFAKFRVANENYRVARINTQRSASIYFAMIDLLGSLLTFAVLAIDANMVVNHSLTLGALVAFLLYVSTFFGPIQQFGYLFDDWQEVRISIERVDELARERPGSVIPRDPITLDHIAGELQLRDVRFHYPGTDREVLHGIDLVVPAGSNIALVGRSGAGKSTVVKLIAKFYDPTGGAVLVDGVDLRDMDPNAYRQALGYVPQEPYLFAGTVRENIAYSRPEATDAEVEAAARSVGAHELILRLSGGYQHELSGDGGTGLSAGQRQLICLARAQLADPAVVLLDEVTSNVDPATSRRVLRAMRAITGQRTTVTIAHLLSTAMLSDRICVIDEGRIVEMGTHEELLSMDGWYAELHAKGMSTAEVASSPPHQLTGTSRNPSSSAPG